jgi:hypothetical protein
MALWLAVALLVPAVETGPVDYLCLDNSRFTLTASPSVAVVRFPDRDYVLPRRPSALAVRYASKEATLYLDGKFAAFVAEDRPLPGCTRVETGERG